LKSKIFIRLLGGYGNQLFIYAFGVALAQKTGRELIIDNISGFGGSGDEYKSIYALDGLDIKHKLITQSIYRHIVGNKYFWYLIKKLKIAQVETCVTRYQDISNPTNFFFEGYWQSYLYFDKYKEEIKKNLTIRNSNNPNILHYKKQILQSKNSVAVGMRFYEETIGASKNHIIKNNTYYIKAMSLLEKKITNPQYFVFTTDVDRAKKIMSRNTNRDIIYIDPIKDKNDAKYDLYLMSLCNNFIISNGTFYWWAAYLGKNNQSLVISPQQGFTNVDAIPPSWIQI
jgi:hypothetical protein